MTLEQYLGSIANKKIAIIGIGVSNTPLIKIMLKHGIKVLACDKKSREQLEGLAEELESLGAVLSLGDDYLENIDADIIFRTPGMHPGNSALEAAKAKGAEITSEMEVFFQLCPCKIIGITGSDGKTTTTTLIYEMLKSAGKKVYVGGNIGTPLLPVVDEMGEEDVAVVELSSFQLMTMDLSPDIAVVTNLAPNHLDIHKSMEEYVSAKENIYLYQSNQGKLVLNLDNDITRSFASKARGDVVYFSSKSKPESGFCLEDGTIVRAENGEKMLDCEDILIPGAHNVENYMAAIAATDGLVSKEDILKVAKNFPGVEHRIELVRTLNGVKYYNDSMSSSPTRTTAGLNSFKQKVILIAGGYDKHIPYDSLGPVILRSVKRLVLTGATAEKIRVAVESTPGYDASGLEIVMEDDFEKAVRLAAASATAGDVVILSPASASFDKFKNYAHRGNTFKQIINSL